MASELPRFLQRIPFGKLGPNRPFPTTDSHGGSPTPPLDQASPPEAPSLSAPQPAAKTGIFRSQPPILLTPPPSDALARAKSPAQLARMTRNPVLASKTAPRQTEVAPAKAAMGEFRILSLSRLAQGGRWRTEAMRAYSTPLLLWFTRGQGRITLAGVTRGFGAHNCIFLPPGTMHGFEVSSQVFGSAVFFPADSDLVFPDEPVHLRFREAGGQHDLTQIIDAMQRELDGSKTGRDRALQHHAGLLSVWLERQVEAQSGASALTETSARRLSAAYTALVEKRFRAGLSVADFASELGVTPSHLTRSCNAACGRSAHDILSDRIMYEARKALAETKVPVQAIARDLGFTSPAYFTRAFQKATGQTPSQFRAQIVS